MEGNLSVGPGPITGQLAFNLHPANLFFKNGEVDDRQRKNWETFKDAALEELLERNYHYFMVSNSIYVTEPSAAP